MFNLRAKLKKTRESLVSPLKGIFQRADALGDEDRDDIEELLIGADLGVETSERILELLEQSAGDYREVLRGEFLELLGTEEDTAAAPPRAIVVVGVNGVGKTTNIAKLAHHLRANGRSVLLAACDTFRAAAADQLAVWADRLGIDMVRHGEGGDPAAVAFDACSAAEARHIDTVIIDTAGRLHTRVNLMEELKKIKRVCEKALSDGVVHTYLALDATLGQNSLVQAAEFTRALEVDGIILTKLDSTAKGGIVIAIRRELGIPVKYIGVGETLEDFAEFSPVEFVDALLATDD